MRNVILTAVGLVGASFACYWNESRLARNDAMRKIPDEIKEAAAKYTFKPTFAELKSDLEIFEMWSTAGLTIDSHRDEFIAELDKQIRMASNGL